MTRAGQARSAGARALVLVLGAIAALAIGCGSPRRDECRTLSTMINATADRVEKAQASPLDPSGLKALADALDKSAGESDALKLTVPELQKQAKAYAALTRQVAQTAREMAAGGEAGDITKAEAANQAMEKAIANEPALLAEVNKLCPSN